MLKIKFEKKKKEFLSFTALSRKKATKGERNVMNKAAGVSDNLFRL